MKENEFLTTSQVAEKLGVSLRRVQALIADGRLPSMQIGREHLIKESDIKLVENRTVGRPSSKLKGYVSDYGNLLYKVEFQTGLQQLRGYGNPAPEFKPFSVVIDKSGDVPKFDWKHKPETNIEKFELDGLELVEEFIEKQQSTDK